MTNKNLCSIFFFFFFFNIEKWKKENLCQILFFSEKWKMNLCGQFYFYFFWNGNETNPEIKIQWITVQLLSSASILFGRVFLLQFRKITLFLSQEKENEE